MARIVTFLPDLATWHPPGDVVEDILTHLGAYTHLILLSWAASGPKWTAAAWVDHNTFPANAVVEFHRCGVKIMVSAGNAEARPISDQPRGGYSYGAKVGEFVRDNELDGVNFEIVDQEAFGAGRGAEWIIDATRGRGTCSAPRARSPTRSWPRTSGATSTSTSSARSAS